LNQSLPRKLPNKNPILLERKWNVRMLAFASLPRQPQSQTTQTSKVTPSEN
jgi:hypothetical protein